MRPQRQWTELKDKALQDTDDALRTLQTFPPLDEMTVQRLREELMLESTYDSNAIEGSCLTLRRDRHCCEGRCDSRLRASDS